MCTVQSGDCFIAKFRGIEAVLCLALETLALNCVILYMLGFVTFITYLNFSNHRMGEKKHTQFEKKNSAITKVNIPKVHFVTYDSVRRPAATDL